MALIRNSICSVANALHWEKGSFVCISFGLIVFSLAAQDYDLFSKEELIFFSTLLFKMTRHMRARQQLDKIIVHNDDKREYCSNKRDPIILMIIILRFTSFRWIKNNNGMQENNESYLQIMAIVFVGTAFFLSTVFVYHLADNPTCGLLALAFTCIA